MLLSLTVSILGNLFFENAVCKKGLSIDLDSPFFYTRPNILHKSIVFLTIKSVIYVIYLQNYVTLIKWNFLHLYRYLYYNQYIQSTHSSFTIISSEYRCKISFISMLFRLILSPNIVLIPTYFFVVLFILHSLK